MTRLERNILHAPLAAIPARRETVHPALDGKPRGAVSRLGRDEVPQSRGKVKDAFAPFPFEPYPVLTVPQLSHGNGK